MFKDKVVAFNGFLNRYMWLGVPLAVAAGVSLGPRISSFSFLGQYFFMLLTLTGALTMEAREFGVAIKRPKPILVYMIAGKIVCPVVCVLAARLILGSRPDAITGYVLVVVGPVAVASMIWTGIFKGNEPLTLTILLIDTLLTPIYMPFATKLLLGASVEFGMKAMALSLLRMVIVPMVVGVGANELSRNRIKTAGAVYFKPVGKLSLICATVLNSSTVHSKVASLRPADWTLVLVSAAILTISLVAGWLSGKLTKTEPRDIVSLTIGSGMKNNTASLVLANTFFTPGASLSCVVHILLQQIFVAMLGKMFFGKPSAAGGRKGGTSGGQAGPEPPRASEPPRRSGPPALG